MSRNLGCSCLPPRQSEWRAPGMLGMVDQLIYMTCTVEPFEDVRKRVPGVRHPKCVRLSRNPRAARHRASKTLRMQTAHIKPSDQFPGSLFYTPRPSLDRLTLRRVATYTASVVLVTAILESPAQRTVGLAFSSRSF